MIVMTQTSLEKAIQLTGGVPAMARKFGISTVAIHKWRKTGKAPPERVLAIEAATAGQVTRYQLRPDIYGEHPEERAA